MMRTVAGLLVYWNDKVLLVKQKAPDSWSIPKGKVEENETFLEAAIRETAEETGIHVPEDCIDKQLYVASCCVESCKRKLFYYKARLTVSFNVNISIEDDGEIETAGFYDVETAIDIIQVSQVGILWDGRDKIDRRITDVLVHYGWLTCNRHPCSRLLIYDYTDKCKSECFWNEVTLWCRGLITDYEGNIIARPLKKFFEHSQLFPECRPCDADFMVSDKIDGFLGIMYWSDGLPRLATRDSFTSVPAVRGTSVLYRKYASCLSELNQSYTYLFEIVYPNNSLVLSYGDMEDLFLIDVLDHNGHSVMSSMTDPPFPVIRQYENTCELDCYISENLEGKEGYVIKFSNGERLKVKFPWFKKEYLRIHEKII